MPRVLLWMQESCQKLWQGCQKLWQGCHNGKLESGSAQEKYQFRWTICKRSGLRKVYPSCPRIVQHHLHGKLKNNCNTLKLSNSVLARVPIKNYYYKKRITFFCYSSSRNNVIGILPTAQWSHLEKIHLSGIFVTRLLIRAVDQTLHIQKKNSKLLTNSASSKGVNNSAVFKLDHWPIS